MIKEIWQAAVKERGDKAFELFEIAGIGWVDCQSNDDLENPDFHCRLKSIAKLIEIDIERYDKWAYLMYMPKNGDADEFLDNECVFLFPDEIVRKPYANLPFNLEWAKAGVAVEYYSQVLCEWIYVNEVHKYIKWINVNDEDEFVFFECGSMPGRNLKWKLSSLRHPLPPTKELGL